MCARNQIISKTTVMHCPCRRPQGPREERLSFRQSRGLAQFAAWSASSVEDIPTAGVSVYNLDMATSVKLRTAVPSVAEFGKSLGISERRQKSLISLVKRDSPSGRFETQKSDGRAVETVRSEKVSRGKR